MLRLGAEKRRRQEVHKGFHSCRGGPSKGPSPIKDKGTFAGRCIEELEERIWWLQDTTGIDELDEDGSCRGPGVFGECGCIWARAANSVHCVTFRSPLRCLIGHVCISTLGGSQGPIEVRSTAGTDDLDDATFRCRKAEAPRSSQRLP